MIRSSNKLALDASSKMLGWVVWRVAEGASAVGWKRCVVAHGTIMLGEREPLAVRLQAAEIAIRKLLTRFKPHAMAIEGPALETPGILNLVQQQRVIGVLLNEAGKAGVPVVEIAPTRAKFALTGDGKADKGAMIAACPRRTRAPFDEHAADALGVARAAWDPTVPPPRPRKKRSPAKPAKQPRRTRIQPQEPPLNLTQRVVQPRSPRKRAA